MTKTFNFYFPCIEDGGLEKNVFALVNSLAEKKFIINFFTYEDSTRSTKLRKKFFFNKRINVITSNFFPNINNRYLRYFFCFIQLFFFSVSNKGIIVSFQGNILPIITAKITGRKIIIRCNTAPSKYINNSFKRLFFKFFYSLSDLILVTSIDFKKEIKKYFQLNSYVHRQSLDIKKIQKQSHTDLKFSFFENFKGLKIINIGRLTHQKDQMSLLKAFVKLIKYRQARLLIIGDGSDRDMLEKFIENNNIGDLVKIIPYTKNPFKYVKKSNVKVLSSRYEGNPNILLEIACLKKIIISSDSKVGPREILQSGKGGFLYKVGKVNKLSKLLRNINVNSKIIKKKVNISYDYILKNYQKDISIPFIKLIKNI
tara:strand:+ start:1436 stop:2545 length:1110 start_codon:yes stop_codon:yes gene_type:complete